MNPKLNAALLILYAALNSELEVVKAQQRYLARRAEALHNIIEGYKELAESTRDLSGPNWKATTKAAYTESD